MQKLTTIEKILLLQDVPLLRNLPTDALAHLAALAQEEAAPEGTELWRQGDTPDTVWFLLQGAVSIAVENGGIHAVSPMTDLGASALLGSDGVRNTSASVVRPAQLLRLGREDFYEVLDEHPECARALLTALGSRVADHLDQIEVGEQAPAAVSFH